MNFYGFEIDEPSQEIKKLMKDLPIKAPCYTEEASCNICPFGKKQHKQNFDTCLPPVLFARKYPEETRYNFWLIKEYNEEYEKFQEDLFIEYYGIKKGIQEEIDV